ncbi:hypothetical protein LZ318_11815 [Saccharopolyspora indica]|uniref:hypothetical protein n=1 Tax=Saccharopolyspora indica TaxID=1229659 RepID=UPI0022EA5E18|nr:hypothetical protein [Saccharopolyspora indica]MDA3643802.1 hypothetical protein [Saccharopolyspora indica]
MDIQDGERVDWTDQQDEDAYNMFVELAEGDMVGRAQEIMRGVQRMIGVAFTDEDLAAWVKRYVDEHTVICEWFPACENEATTVQPHSVLGLVPICERCQERASA